jgi:hypothetical protein
LPRFFFGTSALRRVDSVEGDRPVTKLPQSTPHSDIDGVHQDERPNVDTANEAGQDSGDLKRAHDQSQARPPYADDKPAGEEGDAEGHPS